VVARHPVTAFLVLVFAITVPLEFVPMPDAAHGPAENILGAAVPAVVVTASVSGRDGVRDLVRRTLRWRVPLRWYAVALLGLPLVLLALAPALYGTAPLRTLAENWPRVVTAYLPVLAVMVLNNVAEEAGWTGFLFARLQDRRGALRGALLTSLPFVLWHAVSFVHDTGSLIDGLAVTGYFFLPLLASRVVVAWLYNASGASVLIPGLFHATFNATGNPHGLGDAVLGLPYGEVQFVLGAVVIIVAVAVALATHGRLGAAAIRHQGSAPP
jgi:membrane protease YdiL (CAAX protease family)